METLASLPVEEIEKSVKDMISQPTESELDNGEALVSDDVVRDLATVFKLLSDETRLRILLYLTRTEELHVRALCDRLHQSQPAVSHHLALLRVAGLIAPRREGKHNYYHLQPSRFESLLDTVFAAIPKTDRKIRFEDYVLSYAPR